MRRAAARGVAAAGPENDSTEKPIISILIAAAEAAEAAAENVARRAWEGGRERCTDRAGTALPAHTHGHQSVMDDACAREPAGKQAGGAAPRANDGRKKGRKLGKLYFSHLNGWMGGWMDLLAGSDFS